MGEIKHIIDAIKKNKIIPVTSVQDMNDVDAIIKGLQNGGLNVIEITFRTAFTLDAIAHINDTYPNITIGAGTVISAKQAQDAIYAGASFIVSPGYSSEVDAICQSSNILYIPGCVTPTEIMSYSKGEPKIIKFFPADLYGGVKAIKSLSAVFQNIFFIPTGGVEISNINEYLSLKSVLAVGGSFMFKGSVDEIENTVRLALNETKGDNL